MDLICSSMTRDNHKSAYPRSPWTTLGALAEDEPLSRKEEVSWKLDAADVSGRPFGDISLAKTYESN